MRRQQNMKVKEMIDGLKYPRKIGIKNADENLICLTVSNLEGMEPYLDREVLEWYPTNPIMDGRDVDLYLILKNK